MFDIGFWEISLIGVIALLVIGPERLPGVARNVGFWIGRMRRYVGQVRSDIEREVRADELKRIINDTSAIDDLRDAVEETKTAVTDAGRQLDDAGRQLDDPGRQLDDTGRSWADEVSAPAAQPVDAPRDDAATDEVGTPATADDPATAPAAGDPLTVPVAESPVPAVERDAGAAPNEPGNESGTSTAPEAENADDDATATRQR